TYESVALLSYPGLPPQSLPSAGHAMLHPVVARRRFRRRLALARSGFRSMEKSSRLLASQSEEGIRGARRYADDHDVDGECAHPLDDSRGRGMAEHDRHAEPDGKDGGLHGGGHADE